VRYRVRFRGAARSDEAVDRLAEEIARACRQVAPDGGLLRVEAEIESTDALSWLAAQPDARKVYWRDRDGRVETAGVGAAEDLRVQSPNGTAEAINHIRQTIPAGSRNSRYFGAMRFGPARDKVDPDWAPYEAGWFVLPRFELITQSAQSRLACNIVASGRDDAAEEQIVTQLRRMAFPGSAPSARPTSPLWRADVPEWSGWEKSVRRVLDSFSRGRLEKLVLARRSTFSFESPPDCWALLRRLREATADCFLFGMQPALETAFIGASPELLYRRSGRDIVSEALAATRRRGESRVQDDALAGELMGSDKEQREHRFVADAIRDALEKVCLSVTKDEISVRRLAHVQHLLSGFQGVLRSEVTDRDVLNVLHPTPAVGGFPTTVAQQEIARLEPFDRGWYAAPIGWIGPDEAEFAVAIRSGLVVRNRLVLYSGAGIVQGSTAESEWDELEAKIDAFMKVIASDEVG